MLGSGRSGDRVPRPTGVIHMKPPPGKGPYYQKSGEDRRGTARAEVQFFYVPASHSGTFV